MNRAGGAVELFGRRRFERHFQLNSVASDFLEFADRIALDDDLLFTLGVMAKGLELAQRLDPQNAVFGQLQLTGQGLDTGWG